MRISDDVYILTTRDLDEHVQKAFRRGVERGRFEERIKIGKEPVAANCANWKDGHCETCGAQHQGAEVSADFRCPYFTRRRKASPPIDPVVVSEEASRAALLPTPKRGRG